MLYDVNFILTTLLQNFQLFLTPSKGEIDKAESTSILISSSFLVMLSVLSIQLFCRKLTKKKSQNLKNICTLIISYLIL